MKRGRSSQPLVKALTGLGPGWCWKSFYSSCSLSLFLWPPHNNRFVFILPFFPPYDISTRTLQIFNRMRILVRSSREIQSVCFRFTYSYIIRRHFAIVAWPPGAFWLYLKSSCTGPDERSPVDTPGRPGGICRGSSSRDTAGRCGRGGPATDWLYDLVLKCHLCGVDSVSPSMSWRVSVTLTCLSVLNSLLLKTRRPAIGYLEKVTCSPGRVLQLPYCQYDC